MFVGSFKIWRMLCKREVVPRDSLKAALFGQATPCRGESAYGFFQGLLKDCAAWALHEPSFLFIHCRPVPKTPVLRGHVMCVIGEVPKAMVTMETEATCEMTLCQSCPWRHFKSPDDPQPELIPHASERNTTRLSSLSLCPPGWKALSDEGCRFWPSHTSAAPVFCSRWAGGLGRLLQPTSVLERR